MWKPALALLLVACSSHRTAAPPPSPGSATGSDPWAPSAGSSVDMPAWAHDSPTVLRGKINAVNSDAIVLKSEVTFAEYRDVLATVEHTPGVTAAEPFIFIEATIAKGASAPTSVAVKAVDPARVDRVLALGKHMVTGALSALATGDPPPIVVGDGLAKKLGAKVGDDVTLAEPAAEGRAAHAKTFRVSGMFHMDFDEYDDRLAITALAPVQAFVGRGDEVMGIEMAVADVDHADRVTAALQKSLGGPPYQAMDWYELNKQLFTKMFGDKRP